MAFDINRLKAVGASAAAKKPAQKPVVPKQQPLPEPIQKPIQEPPKTVILKKEEQKKVPDKKEVQDRKTGTEGTLPADFDFAGILMNPEPDEETTGTDGSILTDAEQAAIIAATTGEEQEFTPGQGLEGGSTDEVPGMTTYKGKLDDMFRGLPDDRIGSVSDGHDELHEVPSEVPFERILDGAPGGTTTGQRIDDLFQESELPNGAEAADQIDGFFKLKPETPGGPDITIHQIPKGTPFPQTAEERREQTQPPHFQFPPISRPPLIDEPPKFTAPQDAHFDESQSKQPQTPQKKPKPYTVQLNVSENGARTDLLNGYQLQFNSSQGGPRFIIIEPENTSNGSGTPCGFYADNGKKHKVNDKRLPFKLEVTVAWHIGNGQTGKTKILDNAMARVIPRKPNKAWEWTKKNSFGLALGAFTAGTALVTNVFVPEVKQTVDASGMPEFLKSYLYPVLIPLAMTALTAWSFVGNKVHKKEAKG
jgi:hypothetical protein